MAIMTYYTAERPSWVASQRSDEGAASAVEMA